MPTSRPHPPWKAKAGPATLDRGSAAWKSGAVAVTSHILALSVLARIGLTYGEVEATAGPPPVLIATSGDEHSADRSAAADRVFAQQRRPVTSPERVAFDCPPLESIELPVPPEPANPPPPPELFDWPTPTLEVSWPTPSASEIATAKARPSSAPRPARRTGGTSGQGVSTLVHATPVSSPKPRYPREARRRSIEGTVYLLISIGTDGRVLQATVRRSSGDASLDSAALRGVTRWRFQPATRAGVPTASTVVVPVGFQLR